MCCSRASRTGPATVLAERLAQRLAGGLDRVVFTDGAAEAVRAASTMARTYWARRGVTERRRLLWVGDAGVQDRRRRVEDPGADDGGSDFDAPAPSDDDRLEHLYRLLERRGPQIAAVVFEPLIDRTDGLRFVDPGVVATIASAARTHGALSVANESLTGFGRTGSMFAFEQAGVEIDILCLSKALTGGFMALGAVVASQTLFDACLQGGPAEAIIGGPTRTPNPLACAAALASLDLFDVEPRLQQAKSMEVRLRDALEACQDLECVEAVGIKGAMAVITLRGGGVVSGLSQALIDRGVWVRAGAGLVHLAPALNIAEEDLAELCSSVGRVLKDHSRRARLVDLDPGATVDPRPPG